MINLKFWIKLLVSLFFKVKRDSTFVEDQYNNVWKNNKKFLKNIREQKDLWIYDGKIIRASRIDLMRNAVALMQPYIKPNTSIIELGCGSGMITFSLALLEPSAKYIGIDSSKNAISMATNFLRNPPIKEFSKITGLSRETVEKRFPQINVSFEVGDIRKLPFPENMFDIAITRQSIEQNPESYYQIFGEINRIIRERAIFFEEFEEFQNIFQKLYLKRKNMFHASSKELERYGFVVESLIPSPLKKVKYGIGLVNAKKSHDLPLLHL